MEETERQEIETEKQKRKERKEKELFERVCVELSSLERSRAVGKSSIKISVNKRPALAPMRDSAQRARGGGARSSAAEATRRSTSAVCHGNATGPNEASI